MGFAVSGLGIQSQLLLTCSSMTLSLNLGFIFSKTVTSILPSCYEDSLCLVPSWGSVKSSGKRVGIVAIIIALSLIMIKVFNTRQLCLVQKKATYSRCPISILSY